MSHHTHETTKMVPPAPEAYLSGDEILDNAIALGNKIRDRDLASEYDDLRSLPKDIVDDLRAAGVFRMNMPESWGGPEMNPMQQVRVIEELSSGDASVGWCSFIWTDSGIYSGYLNQDVAREMYPALDMMTSGWVYPVGRADKVEGGYEISGSWMFGSGSTHCDWLVAGCTVWENGEMLFNEDGSPQTRVCYAKPEDYDILDTWYTTGLRGTGSNDYKVEGLFVPEERSFMLGGDPMRPGAIWKRPDHFLRKMSGVPLGVARTALNTAKATLSQKVDLMKGVPYHDTARVQTAIAEASIKLNSARAYVFTTLENAWEKIQNDVPLTNEERADLWMSRTHAFQTGREVTSIIYDAVGGSAIYSKRGSFDRYFRDMQTACQHLCGQVKMYEDCGKLLLGSEEGIHPMI